MSCLEYTQLSRRDFMVGSLKSAAGLLFGQAIMPLPQHLPRLRLANPHTGPRGDTLVCVFLRGGADGLNIVVPHGDEGYYAQRPTLALPRPDTFGTTQRVLDLDGFFGLHPALQPLHAIYGAGDLALVQATGSPDETRSHFEAMDMMERGAVPGEYTGWLARHLSTLDTGNGSALRAVSVGDILPMSLAGALSATALESIADYHLQGTAERRGEMQSLLAALYAQQGDILSTAASQTFAVLDVLSKIDTASYRAVGRGYGERPFGQALQTTAQLIKAEVGVEVACVDLGGWDTHVGQGATEGPMARLLAELGEGLAAFHEDMGPHMGNVTVMVMSEFGRRVKENAGLGTDHGHGNMMMLLGGGIAGGRVYGQWPGLHTDQLVGPGDVGITTDYRHVLAEVLRQRLNNPATADIFPNFAIQELGLTR
ncbi:MAG: DUF1501 domain-containing protein [Chloroflexi bacterium]|nr:DUF1501 domain-containing protein [Chloroflexota bacterium]